MGSSGCGTFCSVPGRTPSELDAEAIVSAAIKIFEAQGLDAVSMRSVSAQVGISPVPVYKRIGNKEALLNAMADRLLADVLPPADGSENWRSYSQRWAIIGFVVLETGRPTSPEPRAPRRRPGGDAAGVSSTEIDELFLLHLGYLLDGFERDSVS